MHKDPTRDSRALEACHSNRAALSTAFQAPSPAPLEKNESLGSDENKRVRTDCHLLTEGMLRPFTWQRCAEDAQHTWGFRLRHRLVGIDWPICS